MFKKILSKIAGQSHSVASVAIIDPPREASEGQEKELKIYIKHGDQLAQEKKYAEALNVYQKAIDINPHCIDAYIKQASVFSELKNREHAVELYQMAIALEPANYYPYCALADIFEKRGNFTDALSMYEEALKHKPDSAEILTNIAGIFIRQYDQPIPTEKLLLQALQLDPQLVEAHINLGVLYILLSRFKESQQILEHATTIDADRIDVYVNLGVAMQCQNKITEAKHCLEKAMQIDPTYPEAKWNYSLILLKNGDYSNGWKYYEHRLKTKAHKDCFIAKRYQSYRKWNDDENIVGKKIIIHAEQGLGDTLQFVRYAPLVAARGATVIVDCQSELVSLLAGVEGVSQVVSHQEPLPAFDCYASIMSLPLLFDTTLETIPAAIPYIKVNEALVNQWKIILGQRAQCKVGLVWAGNPRRDQMGCYTDRKRSITLEQFAPLGNVSNIEWFSLQKGESAKQIKTAAKNLNIKDYTDQFYTFADTAAFITQLDLIISVDTSVAHLAAAIGKPTWLLSHFDGCWRWLMDRDDSPWYPTMRIFRQKQPGDWENVILEVRKCVIDGYGH